MRRNEICNRLLALAAQGLLYHCLACGLYNFLSEKTLQAHLYMLILYIPLFLFTIVRDKYQNFFIFILLHVLISGIILFTSSSYELRVILGGCVILMASLSIHLRLKPEYARREACPPIISICLFLITYAAAQNNSRLYLMQISHYETYLFLILFAVHRSSIKTSGFLKSNAAIKNLPSGQIQTLNKIFLCIFILFMLIGMIAMQNSPLGSLLTETGQTILLFLRRMFISILRMLFDQTSDNIPEETSGGKPPIFEAEGEPSVFLQTLEKILIKVIYLFLIVLATFLLIKLFYEMYKRFYEQHKSPEDESEFLWKNPLKKEHAKPIRSRAKQETAVSANKKIRRLYKKHIRRRIGKNSPVLTVLTPAELEDTVKMPLNDPHTQQRIYLYEKARYSQLECDKRDIETMKQNIANESVK